MNVVSKALACGALTMALLGLWHAREHLPSVLAAAGDDLRRVRAMPATEREFLSLERPVPTAENGVPGLIALAHQLEPIFAGAAPFEVAFTVVCRGGLEPPWTVARAQGILGYHFAPRARILALALDLAHAWLETSEKGLHPALQESIAGSAFLLFYDVPKEEAERLRKRVEKTVGADVLIPGKIFGDRHAVYLFASTVAELAAQDPRVERYRSLLP